MSKIWVCCLALAIVGLVGFVGSSTGAGIATVEDTDAALLKGGQGGGNCAYWSVLCNGCGQPSCPPPYGNTICPYTATLIPTSAQCYAFYGEGVARLCMDCGVICGNYTVPGNPCNMPPPPPPPPPMP